MAVICDVKNCGRAAEVTQHQTLINSSYSKGGIKEGSSKDLCQFHSDAILSIINNGEWKLDEVNIPK